MKSIHIAPVFLVLTAMAQIPEAAAQGAGTPPPVKAWLDERQRECRADRGRFSVTGSYVLQADFNGDRQPDYVLMSGGLACDTPDGMDPFAYGSAGPENTFLMSGRGGYRTVDGFMSYLDQSNIVRRGDRDVLVIKGPWRLAGGIETTSVWSWDGTRMTISSRTDPQGRELDDDGRPIPASGKAAGTGGAPRADPTRWTVATPPQGGTNAYVAGSRDVPLILLRCDAGQPTLHVSLSPRVVQGESPTQLIQFTLAEGQGSASVFVRKDRTTGHWSAPVWRDTLDLLGGAHSSIAVAVGGPNDAGRVTLAGSTAALQQALAPCMGAISTNTSGLTPMPPLNIVPGHYVDQGQSCADPGYEVVYYDGKRFGLFSEDDADRRPARLGKVAKADEPGMPSSTYFLEDWGIMLTAVSPAVIQMTIQDVGEHKRWCPAGQLPAHRRAR